MNTYLTTNRIEKTLIMKYKFYKCDCLTFLFCENMKCELIGCRRLLSSALQSCRLLCFLKIKIINLKLFSKNNSFCFKSK